MKEGLYELRNQAHVRIKFLNQNTLQNPSILETFPVLRRHQFWDHKTEWKKSLDYFSSKMKQREGFLN